jgi:hypothetical protein
MREFEMSPVPTLYSIHGLNINFDNF